ncbi:hypothetical protein [Melissospora conviva]|uniref:hypothetical protein n=1 Tax=Melissospora conviva TaxID=3388432 RepID=UPI003C1B434F
MIDDGPFARLWIHRAVKRFDLDLAAWPWPPHRGGDWATYWEFRVVEILSTVGMLTRKLIEADKISVELLAQRFDVELAPIRSDRAPDKISFPKVERYYATDRTRRTSVSLTTLCNSLVHSFVLVPEFNSAPLTNLRFERFYLASDFDKRRGVLMINWAWFVKEVVGAICADDIVSTAMLRTPNGVSLSLGSRRHDVPIHERVLLFCAASKDNRKRYDRFLEAWTDELGFPRSPWPTFAEARAEEARRGDTYTTQPARSSEIERD